LLGQSVTEPTIYGNSVRWVPLHSAHPTLKMCKPTNEECLNQFYFLIRIPNCFGHIRIDLFLATSTRRDKVKRKAVPLLQPWFRYERRGAAFPVTLVSRLMLVACFFL